MKNNYAAMAAGIIALTGWSGTTQAATDISTNITIVTGHGCPLTVTPTDPTTALTYTVTSDNLESGTAGIYSLTGGGTAKYVINAASTPGCALPALQIQLPVMGNGANNYATWTSKDGYRFLTTAALADLYGTTASDGSGDEEDLRGVEYARSPNSAGTTEIIRQVGYRSALTQYRGPECRLPLGGTCTGTADYVLSGPVNTLNGGYHVAEYLGWPGGAMSGTEGFTSMNVSYLHGARDGAYVLIPQNASTNMGAITLKLVAVVSAYPYVASERDMSALVNGDSLTTTGTLTVTAR